MPKLADLKKATFDDLIKVLFVPLIAGGGSMGGYGFYVLTAKLEAEVEARKALERKVDISEDRILHRLDRIEDSRWRR